VEIYTSVIAAIRQGATILNGFKEEDCTYNFGFVTNFGGPIASDVVNGYAETDITNALGSGLNLTRSKTRIQGSCRFSDCLLNGIHVEAGDLKISGSVPEGVLQGTGNGKVGVFAHRKSLVEFNQGQTPTLTGTNGNVGILSQDAEDTTWADVNAGSGMCLLSDGAVAAPFSPRV
jgi:hypothetical protein